MVAGRIVDSHAIDPAGVGSELFVKQYEVESGVVLYNFALNYN